MKLTDENSDGMDCRPLVDRVNMGRVPDHLRESAAAAESARSDITGCKVAETAPNLNSPSCQGTSSPASSEHDP